MKSGVKQNVAQFRRLRHWKVFRLEASHLFPTNDSLRWFMRMHEHELVASGSLLKLPRGNFIDPEHFAATAIGLMQGLTFDSSEVE